MNKAKPKTLFELEVVGATFRNLTKEQVEKKIAFLRKGGLWIFATTPERRARPVV